MFLEHGINVVCALLNRISIHSKDQKLIHRAVEITIHQVHGQRPAAKYALSYCNYF